MVVWSMNPFNTHWEEYHITKFMETPPPPKKIKCTPFQVEHTDILNSTQTIFHFLYIFGFARSAIQSSSPDALVSHSSCVGRSKLQHRSSVMELTA